MKRRTALSFGLASMLGLILSPMEAFPNKLLSSQTQKAEVGISPQAKLAVAAFEKSAKEYSALRESIEAAMPKLSKESTPEQIQAHKIAFVEKVKAARAGAKPGQLFNPELAEHIRATIRTEFKGNERRELRETVLEADTKGVPLRVNYTYPDTKELVEMPATLLLKLPQLPKQLRYRFVGKNMLLVDRENGLIIDYMLDALP